MKDRGVPRFFIYLLAFSFKQDIINYNINRKTVKKQRGGSKL